MTQGDDDPWYRSVGGTVILGVDVLLVLVLVVGTTDFAGTVLAALGGPEWEAKATVDWYVYLYAALGATGFVFTNLVREFDRSTEALLRYNVRVPAALPLAAGVALLADQLVGGGSTEATAGLAFVTGLFVNTAYERIRDLAVRMLAHRQEEGDGGDGDGNGTSVDSNGDGGTDSGSGDSDDAEH